jgi:hypothetical protein
MGMCRLSTVVIFSSKRSLFFTALEDSYFLPFSMFVTVASNNLVIANLSLTSSAV